jgi:flagellar hook protein FlgE
MSNVDLGQEFTQLIVAQRGFEANSKVITASDEIHSDLVQMIH